MSLLRLLTAGKSLVGLKDGANRYSVARRGGLPKFVSKTNPFRASTLPEAIPAPQPGVLSAPTAPPSASQSSDGNAGPFSSAPSATEMSSQPKPSEAVPVKSKEPKDSAIPKRGLGLAALLPWWRPRGDKPAIPRFVKPMVQGELSLEAIKVVRNDLSDSDLEIVPAQAPPTPVARATPQNLAPEAAEKDWDRVAGSVGAGKT